jgi:acyl-CoA synthetase (AMP-forming)/AMP-acid ligase II
MATLPLSFDYGLSQVTTAFHVGATAILSHFSTASALLREATAEGATSLAGVPTIWEQLADTEWPPPLRKNLRYVTSSGGVLQPATIKALTDQLPDAKIYCMYGLTEAFRSTYLPPAELARRRGSIGRAVPDQEIRVVRPDGSECAAGEVGELVHRGSLVTLGYWNRPEETKVRFRPVPPAFRDAAPSELAVWSGDLVRADDDGFLWFVGRTDQMIKTSGYRVSPTEVEEVVSEINGVVEAAAVGVPDKLIGQRIVVAIVTRLDAGKELLETVEKHCRKQLPAYMAPSRFVVLDTLPRNANQKIDRAALSEILLSRGDSYTPD